MRLFFTIDDAEGPAIEAHAVPTVGDRVWIKTLDFEGTLIVQSVEHQFDRSSAERYDSHDVCLNCRYATRP